MSVVTYGYGIDTDVLGAVPAYGYGRSELGDDVVHPPGMGRRAQIIREDEEIMAIIVAFLHMRGR